MWSSLSKVSPFRYSPTYGDSLTVKSNTLKQLKLWFSMLPNPISSSVNTLFFFSRSTLLGVTSSLNLIFKDHIFLAKNSLKKLVCCIDSVIISPTCSCCHCTGVSFVLVWSMAFLNRLVSNYWIVELPFHVRGLLEATELSKWFHHLK